MALPAFLSPSYRERGFWGQAARRLRRTLTLYLSSDRIGPRVLPADRFLGNTARGTHLLQFCYGHVRASACQCPYANLGLVPIAGWRAEP